MLTMKQLKASLIVVSMMGLGAVSANTMAFETDSSQQVVEKKQHKGEYKGEHKKGHKKGQKNNMRTMFKHLNLSEEQKTQIKALKEQSKVDNEALKLQMKEYKGKVKALMSADVLDEVALSILHTEYQDTFAQLSINKAKHMFAIKQLLTEEQLAKFEKADRRFNK